MFSRGIKIYEDSSGKQIVKICAVQDKFQGGQ